MAPAIAGAAYGACHRKRGIHGPGGIAARPIGRADSAGYCRHGERCSLDMVPPIGGTVYGLHGIWCRGTVQPGTVPPIGGTIYGAGYGRHGAAASFRPCGMVPPMGGTASRRAGRGAAGAIAPAGRCAGYCRHGMWCRRIRRHCSGGGRGRALRGLAGTLGGVPRSRAVDRLHCSRPAGRRMRALRDFNVAIWGNVSMSGAAYVSWAPCGTACLAVGVSVPPSRPCPLIPRLLVRKLGFWRPALPAPRVPCPDPRCPGTVQEPRASSRHGRPRNGLGHAPTRKSAEPAASVACLQ